MSCSGSSYSVSHSIPYEDIEIQAIDLAVVCGSECVSLCNIKFLAAHHCMHVC